MTAAPENSLLGLEGTAAQDVIYAVGDIHGCLVPLKSLLSKIEEDFAGNPVRNTSLVFLGDYVDRGPFSKQVIDVLLHDLPAQMRAYFIRGNHEDIILRILAGDLEIVTGWLQYGGRDTLLSYGVNLPATVTPQVRSEVKEMLETHMPAEHRNFLAATRLHLILGEYCFVHAGIRPDIPIDKQMPRDFLWIRKEFLESEADHGKKIVHGHTITDEPDIRSNRMGIDTGAYATGHLTCLVLRGDQHYLLQT